MSVSDIFKPAIDNFRVLALTGRARQEALKKNALTKDSGGDLLKPTNPLDNDHKRLRNDKMRQDAATKARTQPITEEQMRLNAKEAWIDAQLKGGTAISKGRHGMRLVSGDYSGSSVADARKQLAAQYDQRQAGGPISQPGAAGASTTGWNMARPGDPSTPAIKPLPPSDEMSRQQAQRDYGIMPRTAAQKEGDRVLNMTIKADEQRKRENRIAATEAKYGAKPTAAPVADTGKPIDYKPFKLTDIGGAPAEAGVSQTPISEIERYVKDRTPAPYAPPSAATQESQVQADEAQSEYARMVADNAASKATRESIARDVKARQDSRNAFRADMERDNTAMRAEENRGMAHLPPSGRGRQAQAETHRNRGGVYESTTMPTNPGRMAQSETHANRGRPIDERPKAKKGRKRAPHSYTSGRPIGSAPSRLTATR